MFMLLVKWRATFEGKERRTLFIERVNRQVDEREFFELNSPLNMATLTLTDH